MHERAKSTDVEAFERSIDELASSLTAKILELSRPVTERNNRRWEKFAKMCRRPIIGKIYFETMHGQPAGLESRPSHKDLPGFAEDVQKIEKMAEELEDMKAANMNKYGDEIVHPCDPGDPGRYYVPMVATRRACYEILDLRPFIPDKYDFTSAAGVEKTNEGVLVMDSETKEVLPLNDCDWSWSAGVGIRYHKRLGHQNYGVDSRSLSPVINSDGELVPSDY